MRSSRRWLALGLGVLLLAAAGVGCSPSTDEVAALPFPEGRIVEIKIDEGVASAMDRRVLSFFVTIDGLTTPASITDDREELRSVVTGDIYGISASGLPIVLQEGDIGLSDQLLWQGKHWALIVAIPESQSPEDVAHALDLEEEDGIPWVHLGPRVELPPPDLLTEPYWIITTPQGELTVASVSSCEGRLETDSVDHVTQCDPEHRLVISIFGDSDFVTSVRKNLEVVIDSPRR